MWKTVVKKSDEIYTWSVKELWESSFNKSFNKKFCVILNINSINWL